MASPIQCALQHLGDGSQIDLVLSFSGRVQPVCIFPLKRTKESLNSLDKIRQIVRQISEQRRIRAGVCNHTLLSIILENEMVILRQMTKPHAVSPLRNNYLRFGKRMQKKIIESPGGFECL